MTEWIDKARCLDFDRLQTLVTERITALRMYVENIDKSDDDPRLHNAICRDLIFPSIGLLGNFVESVNIKIEDEK